MQSVEQVVREVLSKHPSTLQRGDRKDTTSVAVRSLQVHANATIERYSNRRSEQITSRLYSFLNSVMQPQSTTSRQNFNTSKVPYLMQTEDFLGTETAAASPGFLILHKLTVFFYGRYLLVRSTTYRDLLKHSSLRSTTIDEHSVAHYGIHVHMYLTLYVRSRGYQYTVMTRELHGSKTH
ncbi:hypothetical protein K474DRAFT_82585 [Panus rudis PR-1116 ss-1]|nr:hypothetical protein K474DRAFT_82585 [Panus rudis PR-1116 ss-1]